MPRSSTYWQADCRMCGWKQLHANETDASTAMKGHRCPTGKRSAGMVSVVTAFGPAPLPEFGVDLGEPEEITEVDRADAIERQRHIEAELADG